MLAFYFFKQTVQLALLFPYYKRCMWNRLFRLSYTGENNFVPHNIIALLRSDVLHRMTKRIERHNSFPFEPLCSVNSKNEAFA